MRKNHVAIDIFFSSICNMNCKYCYIHKSETLHNINKKIREKIADKHFVEEKLNKLIDSEFIEQIALWGAEPTLNFDIAADVFEAWFSIFKNCKRIMLSTNMATPINNLIEILTAANNMAPLLKNKYIEQFFVQISIDGPAWITDENRMPGATTQIVQNYECFMKFLNKNKDRFPNIKEVDISFKPTISTKNMLLMNENDELMNDFFFFGESLFDKYELNYKNNGFFTVSGVPAPTVINVGNNTVSDGIIFFEWLKKLYSLDTAKFKYYRQPLFFQFFNTFDTIFLQNPIYKPLAFRELTCGGGDASIAMNYNGDVYACHRALQFNNPEDTTRSRELLDNSLSANSKTEFARFEYLLRAYHDFNTFKMNAVRSIMERAALYGQADKGYLTNDKLIELTSLFLSSVACYNDSAARTGSINLSTLSFVRFFCNGAFQILFSKWAESRGLVNGSIPKGE